MSVEKIVDRHEDRLDRLAHSLKNLERNGASMYENIRFIKEQLQTLQQAIKNVTDAQNNQTANFERLDRFCRKIESLEEFRETVEKQRVIEETKKEQIKGFAKFIRSNWGLAIALVSGIGVLYGAIDTAYKMPSPSQEQKIIDLLNKVSAKLP